MPQKHPPALAIGVPPMFLSLETAQNGQSVRKNDQNMVQDGAPQRCERWFINHEITPSNYSYIKLYLPFLATEIGQRFTLSTGGPIL